MMVAIISYGPVWGAVISFLGVFASSSVGFMIGRYLGLATVHKLMSDKAQKKTVTLSKTMAYLNCYHPHFIILKRFVKHRSRSFKNELP